ncbi:TonB-dependent receptor plug domain-containing protein [Catenovulum sp. SM1970]|uniref:TonB-dependent receptor plug domain-containing protein n=1 Tax=Marinifaba aquimaris TaxID=2741323 RepID=UPI00157481CB|nr:TonB-dependent receptor plug domain-containing protein [Marinifaba aquimaris]NTS76290.1 TonB-dependent receptor plug domain-containing protein [Marinifaba aquimaris]
MKTKLKLISIAIAANCATYAQANDNLPEEDIERITVLATQSNGIKISTSDLIKLPGTINDPIQSLEALPGVVLATSNSGGPIGEPAIRGSSSKDNLYITDGLDMGYIFHNDGLSVYNPLLIESFELKTGAWSPQYADANGGVIVTQLRDPDAERSQKVLDLSIARSGFLYESGISDDLAFYVSFRESLVHTYVDNFIEDEEFSFKEAPRNRDYQSKLLWQLDSANSLRFTAHGAKDYVEIEFDEDGRDIGKNPDLASGERQEVYYHSQAVSWLSEQDNWEFNTSLNHLDSNQQEREGDIFSWDADIKQIIFKNHSQYFADDYTLSLGLQITDTQVDYVYAGRALPCNTEFEVCPPTYFSPTFEDVGSIDQLDYNVYANLEGELSANWRYQFGVSAIGNDFNNEDYIEPRASLAWQMNDKNRLTLSYGQHHTWIKDYRLLTQELGNPELEASESTHYVLSLDSELEDGWQVRTELYYKDLDNLVVANPAAQADGPGQIIPDNVTTYFNAASGKAYGGEILVNKTFSDNWLGWASLAYSKTERENDITGESFNSEFDLPWIANVVINYQWSDNWTIGAKWRYQSGRRYTDVISSTPYTEPGESEPLFYIPQWGEFNAEQAKGYHRLDIRADYQSSLFGYDASYYFEVLNVYGSQTIQEYEYFEDYSDYEKDYQFPDQPFPSVGVTINF